MNIGKIKHRNWFDVLFFLLITSLVYLPRIGEFTYFKDDWYFIYDGFIGGAEIYRDVALHTRPIRGYLYQFLFSLFDINPFPYHFLLFVGRFLGGLGAFWIFNILWSRQRKTNLFLALLVTIYPGFLWWTGGFEFQAYVLSFSLGILSVFFTLRSILKKTLWEKTAWGAGAFLSGITYLALVEFYIGMEMFRVLAVYLLINRQLVDAPFLEKIRGTLRSIAVFLLIPIGFVIWYQFFFDNWRSAQDAGVQLAQLLSSPLSLLWAGIRFLQGTLNVTLFAWGTPFQQNYLGNRLTDLINGLFWGCTVLILFLLYFGYLQKSTNDKDYSFSKEAPSQWQNEAFWVGLLGVIGGVLPVVLVNRNITFDRLSHYALPASLSAGVLIGALIYTIFSQKKRLFISAVIVFLATLTHHGVASKSINDAQIISEFWWQVAWRAPHINTENDTTLLVAYPDIDYAEGDEVAWATANIIYYPEPQAASPIHLHLPAIRLEAETLPDILMGKKNYSRKDLLIKNIEFNLNFRNFIILTQPTQQSCVHVIDNRWVALSTADDIHVIAGASKSNIENIITSGDTPFLVPTLFGKEPAHNWCYYYQKADLARQIGDWEEVVTIFEKANEQGLHPNDQIELIPFVQAYAFLGDAKVVKQLSTRINTEAFYQYQACNILNSMGEHGYPLSPEMQGKIDELFCK